MNWSSLLPLALLLLIVATFTECDEKTLQVEKAKVITIWD